MVGENSFDTWCNPLPLSASTGLFKSNVHIHCWKNYQCLKNTSNISKYEIYECIAEKIGSIDQMNQFQPNDFIVKVRGIHRR